MRAILVLFFLTLPLLGFSQIETYNNLRVGATIRAEDNKIEYGLREEFRFFSDTSRANMIILAPSFGYLFSDKSRLRLTYWFMLNKAEGSRFNLDYINDFDWIESRLRIQVGWDEYGNHGEHLRHLLTFKLKEVQGFFNPSADFEIFHQFGTQRILDRYRGGIANKFKISENMVMTLGLRSQVFTDKRYSKDYLYRIRITYKI